MLLTPSFLGCLDSKLHFFMIPFCSSIIAVKARALLAISILFPIQALIYVQLSYSPELFAAGSVTCRPAALTSPGSTLQMQNLGAYLRPPNLHFDKIPR